METFQEKNEEPTAKKLKEAKLRGQTPLSKELVASLTLIFCVVLLWAFSAQIKNRSLHLFSDSFTHLNETHLSNALVRAFSPFLLLLGSIFGLLFIAICLFYIVQRGFLFVSKKQEGKTKSSKGLFYPLMMTLVKGGVLVLGGLFFIARFAKNFNEMKVSSLREKLEFLFHSLFTCFFALSLLFVALALLDFFYQRWLWSKEMKMTRDEIKEEKKESEGDQLTKAKFRNKEP
jgi:flagellar biosynthetic protein FlhB